MQTRNNKVKVKALELRQNIWREGYEEIIGLTLIRHGRSRADDEGVHEGRYDSPLTDTGRAQAEKRATHWPREQSTSRSLPAR